MEGPLLQINMTRRDFLRNLSVGGTAAFLSGCGAESKKHADQPLNMPTETPFPQAQKEVAKTTENLFTPQEILAGVESSIGIMNGVYGGFSTEELLGRTVVVEDLATFQQVIASEQDSYVKSDELDRPAVTTESADFDTSYYFRPAIEATATMIGLPDEARARRQFIEYLATHELVHQVSPKYKASDVLHHEIFERMYANVPEFQGQVLTPAIVNGAKIKTTVNGLEKSVFHGLEEAEAIVLGQYALENADERRILMLDNPDYFGIEARMVADLLSRLPGGVDQSVRRLMKYRNSEGGREKYMQEIAEAFKIPAGDTYIFSGSLFYAIDTRNPELYARLVGDLR